MDIPVSEILLNLAPETDLERKIVDSTDFFFGCNYGKPRPGHPEGKVFYHILDVLKNIEKYSNPENRAELRVVGLVHDSFKFKVDRTKPKIGENNHGMLARRFIETFVSDYKIKDRTLQVIELHDEAYNSWFCGNKTQEWDVAKDRARRLIERLGDNLDFYLTFYRCDNETGDKESANFYWFRKLADVKK